MFILEKLMYQNFHKENKKNLVMSLCIIIFFFNEDNFFFFWFCPPFLVLVFT